eukprot:Seg483.2 transcript_id=Seg483.2/GoldUCD/mRNA.D3Y31 product=Fibropellin-3 protein_id=Seg483.2/GoldUCD/D3Y31
MSGYYGSFVALLSLLLLKCCDNSSPAVRIYRSNCRRDALFKVSRRNEILKLQPSNVLAFKITADLPSCAKNCIDGITCRSFNYKTASESSENCQTLDIDKQNTSVTFEASSGWIHYEAVSQVGPRCNLVTCSAGYQCVETCSKLLGYECIDINECESEPCLNGGTCANGNNQYTCSCVPGYQGTNCETNIDDCTGTPCQNGGTCVDGVNKYTCNCKTNYGGAQCQTPIGKK